MQIFNNNNVVILVIIMSYDTINNIFYIFNMKHMQVRDFAWYELYKLD